MNRVFSRKPSTIYNLPSTKSGFTIVELLVVIVVIGILAAITIVAYTGISQKAVASALQSDLSNAATKLKMFQVDNGAYPTANNCPTPGATEICLKLSPGNTFVGYSASNQSGLQTFLLIVSNNSLAYKVTNNTAPTQLASTMQPGVTPGAVLELHGAKANAGTGPGINSPLTTTWNDTSGNGNNGTLTGFTGTTSSGWAGDGSGGDPYRLFDYDPAVLHHVLVEPSASLDSVGPSSFALEVVLSLPPVGVNPMWFMGRGVAYGALGFGMVAWDPATPSPIPAFYWGDGAHGVIGANFTAVPRGTPAHLLVVVNRADDTVNTYTNGSFTQSVSCAGFGSMLAATDHFDPFGSSFGGYGAPLGVYLARLYPFALTPAQVTANYAAGPDW